MEKIGFNCQLHQNRVGFVSHEEDFVLRVLFDTGRRRTQLGIGKKKEGKQNKKRMKESK